MRQPLRVLDFFDNCLTCRARQHGYFCSLAPESLKALNAVTLTNVYPAEALLFAEGQQPRGVFMLCQGKIKLTVSSGDGKTLIVRIALAGEILALSSAITGAVLNCTAETLEPSQVNFVRRAEFLSFLDEHPDAWPNVARQLSAECVANAEHIRSLGLSRSARERLAHLILTWLDERGRKTSEGMRVQLLMTQEDISQIIGTSRETVSRLMTELRAKNVLAIKGSVLTVRNRAALEALVSCDRRDSDVG